MKKVLLAGLMAVTALTPVSSAIAAQPDHARDRRESRAETRTGDREHRREMNQNRQEQRREWRAERRDNRQEMRVERRDDRRDDRRDMRETQRIERQDSRPEWRDTRREARSDWRDDRRDDRQERRDVRRDDRRDDRREWREDRRDWRDGRSRVTVRDRWSGQRRWDSDWRNDRRYDWRRYRYSHRHIYRMPRYYAPRGWDYGYNRFSIGIFLGAPLYSQSYWIDDPWYYRLPPAYGSLRWIRYYDDALLIDIRDGYVVDVIYDFFD